MFDISAICGRCGAVATQMIEDEISKVVSCTICGTKTEPESDVSGSEDDLTHLGVIGFVCHTLISQGELAVEELLNEKFGISSEISTGFINAVLSIFPHSIVHE